MVSVRKVLVALALCFTAFLAVRGLGWSQPIERPLVMVVALGLYLATTWLVLFVESPRTSTNAAVPAETSVRKDDVLPLWACVLAIANAVLVPSVAALAAGVELRAEQSGTWYLGGIGALMTIVMVRRRPVVAWIGIAVLAVGSSAWLGIMPAFALGLIGSIAWVGIAHLVMRSMDKAARDTRELAELQQAASAWQATQAVRQRERRVRVQFALAVAGPVLSRVVAEGGVLTCDERHEARIAEGRLRDELRGARLLDDQVRSAIDAARRRGATVTVFDEGGVDDVDEESIVEIRAELANALRGAESQRLIIRTSPHADVAVTVVGRSAGADGLTDEDSVDLWLEIAHPHHQISD